MKTIRLVGGRILTHFQNKRIIFILFLLGSIFSSLIFIYFYGNILPGKLDEAYNTLEQRLFTVEFEKGTPFSLEKLYALDSFGISDVSVECPADILGRESLPLAPYMKEQTIFLRALRNNNPTGDVMVVPQPFSKEELLQDSLLVSTELGIAEDTLTVNGVPFTITHREGAFVPIYLYTPIATYEKWDFLVYKISFFLQKYPDDTALQGVVSRLQETFPQASQISPPPFMSYRNNDTGLGVISVQYFIAVLSFLFLFQYLLDQNKDQDAIYAIVGASKSTVIKIVFLEISLLSAFCSLCAILLHVFTYNLLFNTINIIENIRYNTGDYALCLGFTVLLSMAAAIPFLAVYMESSAADFKRRIRQ